jgi:hypothetical protein
MWYKIKTIWGKSKWRCVHKTNREMAKNVPTAMRVKTYGSQYWGHKRKAPRDNPGGLSGLPIGITSLLCARRGFCLRWPFGGTSHGKDQSNAYSLWGGPKSGNGCANERDWSCGAGDQVRPNVLLFSIGREDQQSGPPIWRACFRGR